MSNSFIENCINGDAICEEIDDYIDKWHEMDCKSTLREFLGMSEYEYAAFVEDESIIDRIVSARINKVAFRDYLGIDDSGVRLAARLKDGNSDAREILNRLIAEEDENDME